MAKWRLSRGSLLFFSVLATTLSTTPARAAGPHRDHGTYRELCPADDQGRRRCHVKIPTDDSGQFKPASSPAGYSPTDLQSAYGLPANGGAGKIVAIFGASSDYTNAESDLAAYRSQFGLPPCTSANGCFIKIDENGGTSYPSPTTSDLETAIDIEAVSAACPACKIMLVEGGDLDVVLATVLAKGASAYSLSWIYGFGGGTATSCESAGYDASSGLLITAAVGDVGYTTSGDPFPAACTGVLAVGGTTLTTANNARGFSETAWSSGGSNCSPYVAKPSWQTDTGCPTRMEGDVAAIADDNDGPAIYTTSPPYTGWVLGGGTSYASPFVAAALTALGIANGHFSPQWVYQNRSRFFDVTTGSNGTCTGSASYFCTAGVGYDGPTGWGTPNGALLATALPPGSDADGGAGCVTPGGSYLASCTGCAATLGTTGCVLTCEGCTKIDGTQNLDPSLSLPCGGTIDNLDGVLSCDGVVAKNDGGSDEAGTAADAGEAGDASTASLDSGGLSAPMDATTVLHVEGGHTLESGTGASWADPGGPSSSGGCGCATADGQASPASTAVGGGLFLAWCFRRRRRRVASRGTVLATRRGMHVPSAAGITIATLFFASLAAAGCSAAAAPGAAGESPEGGTGATSHDAGTNSGMDSGMDSAPSGHDSGSPAPEAGGGDQDSGGGGATDAGSPPSDSGGGGPEAEAGPAPSTIELAPYFPTWAWGSSGYAYTSLVDLQKKSGLNGVTIAFVLSNGGCNTTQDIEDNLSDVKAFIAAGGHVKASFGGADGTYIESKCTTASAWAGAISDFVDATGITDLDFDIEQDAVETDAVNAMRGQALQMVQASKNIQVAFTLNGDLTTQDLSIVSHAVSAGVKVAHVNLMTMDYGNAKAGTPMAPLVTASLTTGHAQLMTLIPGLTQAQAWQMLGVIPMIGQNDDTEIFSLDDAKTVTAFAIQNHLGLVSFWSIDRDQVCPKGGDYNSCSMVDTTNFQYASIFQAVTQ